MNSQCHKPIMTEDGWNPTHQNSTNGSSSVAAQSFPRWPKLGPQMSSRWTLLSVRVRKRRHGRRTKHIPSSKLTVCYGKSLFFLIGKSTINGPCWIAMLIYWRVYFLSVEKPCWSMIGSGIVLTNSHWGISQSNMIFISGTINKLGIDWRL